MMQSSVDQPAVAWQPFTPRGLALFAHARLRRLVIIQVSLALLIAGAVVWSVNTCWYPTIVAAIDRLPSTGGIRAGQLSWSEPLPQMLAENRFLALAVDLAHSGQFRSPAHLQIEFGRDDFTACSLLGCLQFHYPIGYSFGFNLEELKPWWGAWAPVISALVGIAVVVGLMLSWTLLATLYCVPAWLLALYSDRRSSFRGSWRLASASLIPGALILTVAICLYSLAQIDPLRLIAAFGLHFVAGWVYLVLATLALPKIDDANPRNNPFHAPTPNNAAPQPTSHSDPSNPFRS